MKNKQKTITIKIDEEVIKQLDNLSKKTGIKKKEIAGRALKNYLKTLEQSDAIKFLSKE